MTTEHRPAETGPALAGMHHVAFWVRDFDKSLKFYREALGCTVKLAWNDPPGRAALLDTGQGNYLELFERTGQPAPAKLPAGVTPPPLLHIAIRTRNIDADVERARAAGATVTLEPKDMTLTSKNGLGQVPIRIAFFTGPDGEVFEFFQNEAT